ncbi:hypothetical protein J6590_034443 [Homalodisca vitripennis]|nr:hypothetical protein J6590_034443 [Homalodisca vitripennis]
MTFFRFSRYLELGFLLSSLLASVGRGHLRVSVVGVLKSKLAARSLDEPARCFGVNIVGPTFQSTFHDLVDRRSPWCVGLTPTKNLPVQALETLSGTHLCNFKRVPSFAQ